MKMLIALCFAAFASGPLAAQTVTQQSMNAPPSASPQHRGMEFSTFVRLQNGMTEGELMLRAGRPDHETVENFQHDIVKSYYYYPTASDPFITVVTLRGGRIVNIERTRKAF